MKQVDKMPVEGQFVSVWEFNNEVWSETCRFDGGVLELYVGQEDYWRTMREIDELPNDIEVTYFVAN